MHFRTITSNQEWYKVEIENLTGKSEVVKDISATVPAILTRGGGGGGGVLNKKIGSYKCIHTL